MTYPMPHSEDLASMVQIPLPSHIHYELLLQLLERQTLPSVDHSPVMREQVQQLIITLRKALAQQRQIETIFEQGKIPYEHRWSLNSFGNDVRVASQNENLAVVDLIPEETTSL